jgi:hypothetical protein
MLHPHWVHQATESAPESLPAKWLQAIRDAGCNDFGQWGEQSMFRNYWYCIGRQKVSKREQRRNERRLGALAHGPSRGYEAPLKRRWSRDVCRNEQGLIQWPLRAAGHVSAADATIAITPI